jgi:hypothetical protein
MERLERLIAYLASRMRAFGRWRNISVVAGLMDIRVSPKAVRGKHSTSDRDVWRNLFWILGLGGSIAMFYYECLWCRFALRYLSP